MNMNRIVIGTAINIAPAANTVKFVFWALLTISYIPTATVQFGFERRINLAKIKSTQGPVNCKSAR
ncbi:hypothetical protein D3C76_1431110 [compost metagenome]